MVWRCFRISSQVLNDWLLFVVGLRWPTCQNMSPCFFPCSYLPSICQSGQTVDKQYQHVTAQLCNSPLGPTCNLTSWDYSTEWVVGWLVMCCFGMEKSEQRKTTAARTAVLLDLYKIPCSNWVPQNTSTRSGTTIMSCVFFLRPMTHSMTWHGTSHVCLYTDKKFGCLSRAAPLSKGHIPRLCSKIENLA